MPLSRFINAHNGLGSLFCEAGTGNTATVGFNVLALVENSVVWGMVCSVFIPHTYLCARGRTTNGGPLAEGCSARTRDLRDQEQYCSTLRPLIATSNSIQVVAVGFDCLGLWSIQSRKELMKLVSPVGVLCCPFPVASQHCMRQPQPPVFRIFVRYDLRLSGCHIPLVYTLSGNASSTSRSSITSTRMMTTSRNKA